MIFSIFLFLLSLQNQVCILHLQHLSVRTDHTSSVISHLWPVAFVLGRVAQSCSDLEFRLWGSKMDFAFIAARGMEVKYRRELRVCICMCVGVYVWTCVYHVCTRMCCVCMYVCMCMREMCTCAYVCTCMCMSVCMYVYMGTCVCVCICEWGWG